MSRGRWLITALMCFAVAAAVVAWALRPGLPAPPTIDDPSLDPLVAALIDRTADEVRQRPRDLERWRRLAMVYHAHYLIDQAETCYRRVLEADASDARAWYQLARIAERRGEPARAIELIDRVGELDPGYVPVLWRRGYWRLELGELEAAERAFDEARHRDPDEPAAVIGLGRAYLDQGRFDDAVTALEQARDRYPEQPYIHHLLAAAYRGVGRLDDATEAAQQASGTPPQFEDPWSAEVARLRTGYAAITSRVEGLIRYGRFEEALVELAPLGESHADEPRVHNLASTALAGLGRLRESIEALRASVDVDPDQFVAHLNLSYRLEQVGDFVSSLSHVERAIEIDPEKSEAYAQKGRLLIRAQRFDEAIETMRAAIARGSDHPENSVTLGQLLDRQGRAEEAKDVFRQVLAEHPDHASAHIGLALASATLGEFDQAWAALERARALEPTDPFLEFATRRVERLQGGGG